MPFCPNCGKPYKEHHKFCQSCGMPVEPLEQPASQAGVTENIPQSAPPIIQKPNPPPPPMSGETIAVVINDIQIPTPQRERLDYNLILTNFRGIFARKTNKVGQDAMKMRNDTLSAQKKGFFARWKDQVAGTNMYIDWYKSISPEQALKETPGNFAIDNASIISIKMKTFGTGEDENFEFHTEIQTTGENLKFISKYDTNKLLKQVFSKQLFK
jgi:hypothetical protein